MPAQNLNSCLQRDSLDLVDGKLAQFWLVRQKEHPHCDVALSDHLLMMRKVVEQKRPGYIELQASPMPGGSSVVKLLAKLECFVEDFALRDPFAGGEKTDSASSCFEPLLAVQQNFVHGAFGLESTLAPNLPHHRVRVR
jgi:hypothetical protein